MCAYLEWRASQVHAAAVIFQMARIYPVRLKGLYYDLRQGKQMGAYRALLLRKQDYLPFRCCALKALDRRRLAKNFDFFFSVHVEYQCHMRQVFATKVMPRRPLISRIVCHRTV